MKQTSGFGSGGLKANGGSEGSSSASRFYDNGADSSSISDNYYPDQSNGVSSNINNSNNGFKLAFGQQQAAPQINNRSNGIIFKSFWQLFIFYSKIYFL